MPAEDDRLSNSGHTGFDSTSASQKDAGRNIFSPLMALLFPLKGSFCIVYHIAALQKCHVELAQAA